MKSKSLISKILNLEKLSDDASQQNTDQWEFFGLFKYSSENRK